MKKIALFVFNGEPMCFIHVLLNAINLHENEYEVKIIIEGASVKLIPDLYNSSNPLNKLWRKVLDLELVEGVCKACSTKLGTVDAAKDYGLNLLDDMSGHPSIFSYKSKGFEIITF